MRVFQAILEACQSTKMNGGHANSICLHGLAGALCGRAPGCSERTFQNGRKEFLLNKFVASVKECRAKNHGGQQSLIAMICQETGNDHNDFRSVQRIQDCWRA